VCVYVCVCVCVCGFRCIGHTININTTKTFSRDNMMAFKRMFMNIKGSKVYLLLEEVSQNVLSCTDL